MTTEAQVKELAKEAYEVFHNECCDEQFAIHNGDKVQGMNAMQGFDWPEFILTGTEMEDECAEYKIKIPEDAIGVLVYRSVGEHGPFVFTTDSEEEVTSKLALLYYAPEEN